MQFVRVNLIIIVISILFLLVRFLSRSISSRLLFTKDLLPLLPDLTEIEFLKDEICQSLEACGNRIENLKIDMDTLSESISSTILVNPFQ